MTNETKRPQQWDYQPQTLAGKKIVIGGGTTGIGRATAILLASQGARVLIFGRHEPELQETLQAIETAGGQGHGVIADQSRIEDVERVFQEADAKLGKIDVLVNSAAVETQSVMEGGELKEALYTVQTNIFGYIACSHQALQRMKGQGGHIVNVGSMSADAREASGDVYVATKAAIQGFSGSLRKSANKEGIRVTLVEPGRIATPLGDPEEEEVQEQLEQQAMIPPEDIAECVLYCLTQPSRCDVVEVRIRPLQQLI
jgi:NADP-dependent 3-hydroxy acid dehydrogenase YdfG